jgi:hypothetical protein
MRALRLIERQPLMGRGWRFRETPLDAQMVPTIRIERMTSRLQGGCSTS